MIFEEFHSMTQQKHPPSIPLDDLLEYSYTYCMYNRRSYVTGGSNELFYKLLM